MCSLSRIGGGIINTIKIAFFSLFLVFDSIYHTSKTKVMLPCGSVKLWVNGALKRMANAEVLELRVLYGMLPGC